MGALADMKERMIIQQDTREPHPWLFTRWPQVGTVQAKLDEGDYAIFNLRGRQWAAVERKSGADYVGTIAAWLKHDTTNKKLLKENPDAQVELFRFEKELIRLRPYHEKCIVVEESLRNIRLGRYQSLMSPESIRGMTQRIIGTFGIDVIFGDDSETSEWYTYGFLERAWKHWLKEHTDDAETNS